MTTGPTVPFKIYIDIKKSIYTIFQANSVYYPDMGRNQEWCYLKDLNIQFLRLAGHYIDIHDLRSHERYDYYCYELSAP